MKSTAKTVEKYLSEIPLERRTPIEAVRKTILAHLPQGFEEGMNWGMIVYEVPLSTYPNTYNGQPLSVAALSSQKNYMAIYLLGVYSGFQEKWLRNEFKKRGKKLHMGKCCIRFKKLEEIPLDVIGKVIAKTNMKEFIKNYERTRSKISKGKKA